MGQYIRALSARTEFSIVVLIAFGYFISGSILLFFAPSSSPAISEAGLQFLLVYESVVLIALGGFLLMRGWRFQQVGLMSTPSDVGIGVGLAVAAYLTYAVAWHLFGGFISGAGENADGLVAPGLNLMTVLAVSILNPIFEEVFVCGYVISALRKTRGITFAINVSVGVRLAYHLYQGAFGAVSIIPIGLVFAYWFARTGRLWPVVVAHGILDLAGLIIYVKL